MEAKLSERQSEIIQLLKARESMSVDELASVFSVTPMTIRRDLIQLDEQGLIKRSRGGAYIPSQEDTPFEIRTRQNISEKTQLADLARTYIHSGETIILDSGSTMAALAGKLMEHADEYASLSVITNSLPTASMMNASRFDIGMPGGALDHKTSSLIGPTTDSYFESIVADKFFLAASGMFIPVGLTIYSPLHISLKKKMMASAAEVIAVIDSSKFNVHSTHIFCEFPEITHLITMRTSGNAEQIERLQEIGVHVDYIDAL